MRGEPLTYTSVDTIVSEDGEDPTEYPQEFIYTLTPSGLPPHQLTLKRGSIVTLLANLNSKNGLRNGSKLIIQNLRNQVFDCEVLTGTSGGKTILIPRIKLQPTGDFLPSVFERLQLPVRRAFAMSINKAQAFEKVGLV